MSSKNLREEINNMLGNLRQRIELEDDDFHYDAVLEAGDQILSHLKSQIKKMECPYTHEQLHKENWDWIYGWKTCKQDILSKLQ